MSSKFNVLSFQRNFTLILELETLNLNKGETISQRDLTKIAAIVFKEARFTKQMNAFEFRQCA